MKQLRQDDEPGPATVTWGSVFYVWQMPCTLTEGTSVSTLYTPLPGDPTGAAGGAAWGACAIVGHSMPSTPTSSAGSGISDGSSAMSESPPVTTSPPASPSPPTSQDVSTTTRMSTVTLFASPSPQPQTAPTHTVTNTLVTNHPVAGGYSSTSMVNNPSTYLRPGTDTTSASDSFEASTSVSSGSTTSVGSAAGFSSDAPPSSQHTNAAVAGGVVGGLAFLLAILLPLLWHRRRHHRRNVPPSAEFIRAVGMHTPEGFAARLALTRDTSCEPEDPRSPLTPELYTDRIFKKMKEMDEEDDRASVNGSVAETSLSTLVPYSHSIREAVWPR
ncbi:hypothetical protein DAEQUDRAFT_757238 [Daedalea quercina L-15889]|uniref:Uncharacterized protein n=1 Tax=Daedalea quercina L-15889 TaxID=1314783 RepID=A0A165Q5K5_9APHY|nr:hypothetical protein DAEQUDRAFT_757238 [Daedalea quercina L-15889]